jgi:hypothetical protein
MKNLVLASIVTLTSALICPPLLAWESYPEFMSMTELEQESTPNPKIIDSEYQSDIRTYSKPTYMEEAWVSHQNAFDMTAGSISSKNFVQSDRLKLSKELAEDFEFRLKYINERNHEREAQFMILELLPWITPKWGISFYGQPYYRKRKNDMGIAIVYKPQTQHEIRLFNTFVDLVRNERNDRKDRFEKSNKPAAMGIVGRKWKIAHAGRVDFLQYALRYEPHAKQFFPNEKFHYEYWKKFASVFWRTSLNETHVLTTRAQFDQKLERNSPTDPASAITETTWMVERILAKVEWEWHEFYPNRAWYLMTSLQFAGRFWINDNHRIHHENLIPAIALIAPPVGTDKLGYSFEFENPFFQATGPKHLLPERYEANAVEQRFNFGLEWFFGEYASIRLLFTFDLDHFEREPFEGGNGQMHLVF